jgi:hypothetical protein
MYNCTRYEIGYTSSYLKVLAICTLLAYIFVPKCTFCNQYNTAGVKGLCSPIRAVLISFVLPIIVIVCCWSKGTLVLIEEYKALLLLLL